MFHEIIEEGGCIISEYEPDTEPNSKNFPIRNRIISGLADGVLVVEAKSKSGSGITARLAKKQNKKVYCIPSNIDSKNGVGTGKNIIEVNTTLTMLELEGLVKQVGVNEFVKI